VLLGRGLQSHLLQVARHAQHHYVVAQPDVPEAGKVVFDAIRELMAPPARHGRQIGFRDP
jgi:hypothetical protein